MQYSLYYCKKKPPAYIFKPAYLHIYNSPERTLHMNVDISVADQKVSASKMSCHGDELISAAF